MGFNIRELKSWNTYVLFIIKIRSSGIVPLVWSVPTKDEGLKQGISIKEEALYFSNNETFCVLLFCPAKRIPYELPSAELYQTHNSQLRDTFVEPTPQKRKLPLRPCALAGARPGNFIREEV